MKMLPFLFKHKVILLFAPLALLSFSCRPVYNLGNTPYAPVFEKKNELVSNFSSNSNNVHELNLSFRGKSKLYYNLSGGLGSRDYISEGNSLVTDYRTKESMFKLGLGVDNLFDEQIGILFNAGFRKNRNTTSEYLSLRERSNGKNKNYIDDFTNTFRSIELIPYIHIGKKKFITTLGIAFRHDVIVDQKGEYNYLGDLQSEVLLVGQDILYYDPFVNFLFKTKIVDIGLNITGTSLTEEYIEYGMRVAFSFSKRFQIK